MLVELMDLDVTCAFVRVEGTMRETDCAEGADTTRNSEAGGDGT